MQTSLTKSNQQYVGDSLKRNSNACENIVSKEIRFHEKGVKMAIDERTAEQIILW